MNALSKPFAMGAGMGLMMLWMLHGALTENATVGMAALIGFVAIHGLLVLLAVVAVGFAARLSPSWRERLQSLHRPSLPHITAMLAGLTASAMTIHLYLHGGVS